MKKLLSKIARIGVSAVLALNIVGFVPVFAQGAQASGDDNEDDDYGTIIIKKKVVAANSQPDDGKFNLLLNGTVKATNVVNNGTTGSLTVPKGDDYTVSETAGTATNLSHYTTSIVCVDYEGDEIASSTTTSAAHIEVKKGKTTTCTITNTRKKGSIKIVKDVVNNNGGTKTAANFTFKNNGGIAQTFSTTVSPDGEKVLSNLPVGSSYEIKEVEENMYGYATTYTGCSGVVSTTQSVCTIKNDDIAPTLTLVKTVINDNGGTKTQANFQAQLDGFDTPWGTKTTTIGEHTVSEPLYDDYTQSVWGGDCSPNGSITLALGDNKTCTITNDDKAPSLTLVKILEDSFGSDYEESDWTLTATGPTTMSGAGEVSSDSSFDAGSYTLSEDGPTEGIKSGNWSCDNAKVSYGVISVLLGQNVRCTITNTVLPAKLTVNKVVINDNSGSSEASDFSFSTSENSSFGFENDETPTVKGAASTGSRTIELSKGIYTVVEDQENNGEYTTTYSGDCFEVMINNGEEKTCTITNNDVPHPSFYVVKDGPAWAHEGDSLFYTFTVINDGDANLSITDVTDSITGAGTYWYGDDEDGVFEPNESWVFYGQYVVPEGQVENVNNTVVVCAEEYAEWNNEEDSRVSEATCFDDEGCVEAALCDTDTHSTDILHPSINVEKTGPSSASAGSNVTYTFTVTNTGDVALSGITVIDSITGDATLVSGDENEDGTLDLEETWVFTATYTIPANQTAPVVNTVEACGYDTMLIEFNDRALRAFGEQDAVQVEDGSVQVCDDDSHTLAIPQVLGASTTSTPTATQAKLVNTGSSMATLFSMVALFNIVAALTVLKKQFVSSDK